MCKSKTGITLIWRYLCVIFTVSLSHNVFAQDCFEDSIKSPTPFMGNDGEIFQLYDRSLWEVKYEYEYLYEYYPNIVICPDIGKLIIDGKSLTRIIHE